MISRKSIANDRASTDRLPVFKFQQSTLFRERGQFQLAATLLVC